jgi:uridine monophosphate synthetase
LNKIADKDERVVTGSFAERLDWAIAAQDSLLCAGLDPDYRKMPAEYKTGDVANDIFRYNKRVIDGAAPYVAAFKPQHKFYAAEGEEGIRALRMTCDYVKQKYPQVILLLDAKYADIGNTLEQGAREAYDVIGADAVTAMPAPGRQALEPLFSRPGKGCFMVVRTSNPGAEELQDIETVEGEPLYVAITRKIAEGWNASGNVGLVAPATEPRVLARVRQTAPEMPILCPGVGAQGGDLEAAVAAGVDANGRGLLINISRGIMEAPDPGQAAREGRDRIRAAAKRDGRQSAEGVGQKPQSKLERVVLELFDIGAIRFESFTLKSGLVSPYYNNLRILSSYPRLLRDVASLMAETIAKANLKADIVVGIAAAGVPLGVAVSQYTGIPGGYVRSEAKSHGTKNMVEGAWPKNGTAVLIDDVVSDGASKAAVIGYLQEAGLQVHDFVVVVDRGQGGPAQMAKIGLQCHSVVTMDRVLDILLAAGKITAAQVEESRQFMRDAQKVVGVRN